MMPARSSAFFNDAAGNKHGFLEDTNGAITVIDVPGATLTQARGIDNNGDIVGLFDDATGQHGFLRDPNGHFTTIDVPGSTKTEAFGVNDARQVVGVFADREGPLQGFVAGGVSGTEDNPIALGIKAALGEVDPDAVLSVTISGLPSGVTLSDASNDPPTIDSNGSIVLTPDQLAGLTLTSDGEVQHFNLTVTATTVDGGDTATKASTTELLRIDVTPVADKPTLMVTDASGTEDQPIALDIQPASADPADQDTVIAGVTIAGVPAGAMLDHGTIIANVNGVTTWSVDPADVSSLALTSDGEVQQIELTVTATAVDGGNTATAAVSDPKILTIDVTPVADKPTLTVTDASGNEDHAIALNIQPALAEADADAALTVMITGLPSGVTLSNTNEDPLTISNGSITLTPAQLAGLTLTSDGETKHFDLAVTATTVDGGNTATAASTTATLHVDVTPVADAPVLNVVNVSGNEDHAIALNIAALGEVDADAALTVTITGLPSGVTLSNTNGDALTISNGSITLTPDQLAGLALTSDGEAPHFDLQVTATTVDGGDTATAASTSQTLHVDVTPVADAPVLTAAAAAPSVSEDGTVALNITATPAETDADAVTTVTISGLGTATLSAGQVNPDGSVTLQLSDLKNLTLHAADDDTASLNLTVKASTNDNGSIATAAQTINLVVNPVVETPTLAATAAASSVNEDGTVALNITATPAETDADAVTTVTVSGLGTATLSAGQNNHDGSFTLQLTDLPGLTLHAADDDTASLHLTVTTNTNDNGSIAFSTAQTIDLAVNPVAETPLIGVTSASGVEDRAIPLNIQPAPEGDPDAITTVTIIGLPSGVTLSDANGDPLKISDGSITLTGAQLAGLALTSDGETQHFDLSVTATTVDGGDTATAASTTATLHVDVTPVADLLLTLPTVTTTFDLPPGDTIFNQGGINDAGTTVGSFQDSRGHVHGFVLVAGAATPTVIDLSTNETDVFGINDAGTVVGRFVAGGAFHGFVLNPGGTASVIDVPGAISTELFGINASGEIVGDFTDAKTGSTHGFIDIGGSFTTIDLGNGILTEVQGVDNAGDIVGFFFGTDHRTHGFLLSAGAKTPTVIDVPGALVTEAIGIDSAGEIVGFFQNQGGSPHAFVDRGGILTIVNPAGATFAEPTGVSSAGQLDGFFIDLTGGHAFEEVNEVSGKEDTPINLGINAGLGEVDADATLTVTIAGLPSGVTLSNTNGDPLKISNGSITLTPDQLAGLALTSDGEAQHFDLTVTANAVDGGNATTAPSILHVDVTPVAETPVLSLPAPVTTTFDLPGKTLVSVNGINNVGTIVGTFLDNASHVHGFVLAAGTVTQVDVAGAISTQVNGIGPGGAIVGTFVNPDGSSHGFVKFPAGMVTTIDPAGSLSTQAFGINGDGEIVGSFIDSQGQHGFVDVGGTFTTINVPGAQLTEVRGVDAVGDIVGRFEDSSGLNHGFLLQAGATTPTTIDVPGATETEAMGINDARDIVGFFDDQQGQRHAFVDQGGTFTTVDPPGAAAGAQALGINQQGQLVGVFETGTVKHGFEVTLPEVTGVVGAPVALNTSVAFGEADADAASTVTISGIPTGITFSAGTLSPDGTSLTLTAAELAGLTLTGNGRVHNFDLTVTATTVDGGDQATAASVKEVLHVNLISGGDAAPSLFATAAAGSVNEDVTVALDIVAAPGDATVTVKGLGTATLNHGTVNQDGSVTLQQSDLVGLTLHAADDDTSAIQLIVTATTNNGGTLVTTAQQTINLAVNPVPEAPTLSASAIASHVLEGGLVGLTITPTFETDPDAVNTITINGLNGATLSAGTVNQDGSVTLTPAQLVGLTLTEPGNSTTSNLTLQVTATASEGGGTSASSSNVNEGGTVALEIVAPPPGATITVLGLGTATLNHGTVNHDGSVTLQQSDLAGLTLHAADDDTSAIHLTVTATTNNGGTPVTTALQTVDITVNPVAETPTLAVSSASGSEDHAIALNIQAALSEADADAALTVTITGLPTSGVTLSNADGKLTIGSNGDITLRPDQLANLTLTSDGETEHFDLTVTATAQDGGAVPASTSATLHVDVTPVPDVTVTVVKEVLGVPGNIVSIPISEAPHELDADASLGPITISGFPQNSGIRVLFGANQQFQVAPDATGTVTLSPDQLTNLALQMPATDLGSFTLHVAATVSDGSVTETIHNNVQVLDLPNVQQLDIETVAQGTQPAGQPQGPAGASVNAQIDNVSSDPQNPIFQFTFNSPADHGNGGSAIAGTDADPTDATASHFFINPTGAGPDSIIVEANPNNNFGLSGGDAGAVGPTGQNLPFDEVVSDVNHTVVIDPIAGVIQTTEMKTVVVETPDGPNGGNGAAGGAGSHGTALLDQVIVDRGPDNNDGIFVQVEGSGATVADPTRAAMVRPESRTQQARSPPTRPTPLIVGFPI